MTDDLFSPSTLEANNANVVTVRRAMALLGEFTDSSREWGISELARKVRLGRSQVHRLLSSLAADRIVEVDPVTRRYRLGPRLVALGRLAEQNHAAHEVLVSLSREAEMSSFYCQRDGHRYRCSAAVDGPGPLYFATLVGERFPAIGGGASGDAIFAHLQFDFVRTLWEKSDATGASVDWIRLEQKYQQIRTTGIAVSHGEFDPRTSAVAAPVFSQGAVVGSVSVIGARNEDPAARERMEQCVHKAASKLTRLYQP